MGHHEQRTRRAASKDRPPCTVSVPRLPWRTSMEQCRGQAMAIAASKGVTGPPTSVTAYDGPWSAFGGPMRHPQGYRFV